MNCPQTQTELSAYVDGELPPSIRAEVEAHIEGCAACRKRLAELRKLAEGVAALPKPQPAPQFLAAVRRKIARGETPEQRNWIDLLFRPVWVKVPIEVVALAAILVVAAVLVTPPRRNTAQQTLAMNRKESTPAERAEARANGREVLTAGGGKSATEIQGAVWPLTVSACQHSVWRCPSQESSGTVSGSLSRRSWSKPKIL